jgi:hypothetical protein
MRYAQCARLAGGAFALAFLASCSDTSGGSRVPTAIAAVSGNNQNGQAGSALTNPIVIRVSDAEGGIPNLTVTFAIPQGQGGILSPAAATTDVEGNVQTVWNLGNVIGSQTFTATVAGLAPATIQATVAAGPATTVNPVTPTTQFVVAGRLVPIQPIVRVTDGFGNPRAGETVTFIVGATGGAITGPTSKVTDADGRATVDGWSIGPAADFYTLSAEAGTASVAFNVFGIPAQIQATGGSGQSANAGTQVPVPPSVIALGDNGQPLSNVPVNFEVTQGGGTALGSSSVTGANGVATAGGWILGLTPGANRLEGKVTGVPTSAVFTATGVQAIPASIVASSIPSQNGFFGNFSSVAPAVSAKDASGKPVAGAAVSFAVTEGGGLLIGAGATTDFMGRAATSAWRFGSSGTQIVRGALGALPPVDFTVNPTGVPAGQYQIEVRYPGNPPTAGQKAAFDAAIARWQSVVIGDVGDGLSGTWPADLGGFCPGVPALNNEPIDDLLIFARLETIDGQGGVLGQAGPCLIRDEVEGDVNLTILGLMRFDVADLDNLEASGRLNEVILHEMGHLIGIGTLWEEFGLLVGRGTSDPFFTGPSAGGAFLSATAAGTTFSGSPVPVENQGGLGTRDSHWRESILGNELMTGFLNNGVNPLSAFTIASLRDMGYVVNDAVADAFTFLPQLLGGFAGGIRLVEAPLKGPIIMVDRRGRETRRIPRVY